MANAPVIRRAGEDDTPALARLRFEFRSSTRAVVEPEADFVARAEPWMAERLRNESWRVWVAEVDGALVGTLWVQIIEKLPNPGGTSEEHAYVSSVYVRP